MRSWTPFLAALLTLLVLSSPTRAGGGPECIRRNGPAGLAMLMTQYADPIRQHREGSAVANWASISAELDAVAAQRDAWASGLYWYTDLDQAQAAAKRENKPIVSLRLLGRLDAELSCANSRFFRTTLYPAAEVSKRMRENFILHWSSERPAPVVTIDYGDGRKLQRTVTGNSAHYMMTGDGTVVDVLPGLYGAKPFAAWLDDAGDFARRVSDLSPSDRPTSIRAYHIAKRAEVAGSGKFKDAVSDDRMRAAYFGNRAATFELVVADYGVLRGPFVVAELSYSGEHDGEAEFSVRLASAGMISFEAI